MSPEVSPDLLKKKKEVLQWRGRAHLNLFYGDLNLSRGQIVTQDNT